MKSLNNITWDRLMSENAVTYPSLSPTDPGQPIVFGDGFPRTEGRAKFTPAAIIAPDDKPDADYPMILTTGRQLEHWHTGSMTRRASVLDAVEPEANCSLHPKTLAKLGVEPGAHVRLSTKRGRLLSWRVQIARWPRIWCSYPCLCRSGGEYSDKPCLGPYGKIPEFKYSAVRVEAANIAAE